MIAWLSFLGQSVPVFYLGCIHLRNDILCHVTNRTLLVFYGGKKRLILGQQSFLLSSGLLI